MSHHRRRGVSVVGFFVEVEAYDAAGAHAQASLAARQLLSHVVAEHRVGDLRLRREARVWAVGASSTSSHPSAPRSVPRGRTLRREPIAALSDSLISYSRAREERAPAWSATSSWSALDSLALGAMIDRSREPRLPQGRCPVCKSNQSLPAGTHLLTGTQCPCCSNTLTQEVGWAPGSRPAATIETITQTGGAFLPPHCSAVIVLASMRNALTGLWHALRDVCSGTHLVGRWNDLQKALGVTGNKRNVDLEVWLDVLRAADGLSSAPNPLDSDVHGLQEAGAVVHELCVAAGPFTERWLADLRDRLLNGQALHNWCESLQGRAELQLRRTKFLRHSVVHRATHHTDSALQLREAAQHIVDSVYEVLPYWLDGRLPWEALRAARAKYDDLLMLWVGQTVPVFNADRVIKP